MWYAGKSALCAEGVRRTYEREGSVSGLPRCRCCRSAHTPAADRPCPASRQPPPAASKSAVSSPVTVSWSSSISNAARLSDSLRIWGEAPQLYPPPWTTFMSPCLLCKLDWTGLKANGTQRCRGRHLLGGPPPEEATKLSPEFPPHACMSSAISVSPLLALLLLKLFFAPRTLSSMIGGSGMPTCRPRRKLSSSHVSSSSQNLR